MLGKLQMKAISSVKWTTLQTIFIGICGPVLLIIQARFLSPFEFGVLAILTILIGFIQTINDFGISQAVIQRDNVSQQEFSSLFFFNISLITVLSLCLFLSSGIIASIFEMRQLDILIKVMSMMLVVTGPALMYRAFLEKLFQFKALSIIHMIAEIILIFLSFIFLYHGMGLLGIVMAQVITTTFNAVSVIFIGVKKFRIKPSFYFNFRDVKSFVQFGVYVSAKQIMTFFTHRVDQLIIGYFLAPEILGIYNFAKSMLERLRSLITSTFSKVLFPFLSRLKHNKSKLSLAYSKISQYVALFSFPVFVGIALTSHLFVPILFGKQWIDSIPFFQVFSLALIPLVMTANLSTSLLYSVNKPGTVLIVDLITNIIYILCLLIFIKVGVYGVLVIYCSYVLIKTFTLQYIANRYLDRSLISYVLTFWKVLAATFLLVISTVISLKIFPVHSNNILQFIFIVCIGVIIYVSSIFFLDRRIILELKSALLYNKIDL